MPKFLIFIPRSAEEAEKPDVGNLPSLLTQAKTWETHVTAAGRKKAYDFFVRCYGGDRFPGDPSEGGADNQIYIYAGHGLPGVDGAGWPGDPGKVKDQVVLSANEIAKRISEQGWAPGLFVGKVKVWVCHSGAGDPPFASLVAKEMRDKGWTKCSYFGYEMQVTQTYSELKKIQLSGFSSAWDVPVETLQGFHRWAVKKQGAFNTTQGRASTKRKDF